MGLFEGLTVPAKQVLVRATEAAAAMDAAEVEGAHLLVGVIDADETATRGLLAAHLPDRAALFTAARQATLPATTGGQRPAFGQEVLLTLATARGITIGSGATNMGSGTLLLALFVSAPRSVEDALTALHADIDAMRLEGQRCDDSDEPVGPPTGHEQTWTVTTGATTSSDGWDDHR